MADSGMRRYFNSPTLSDVEICFGGRQVYAHRVVLGSHSAWFKNASDSRFKEASLSTIELHEDDSDAVEIVLQHCYDFDVAETLTKDIAERGTSGLLQVVRVHAAADKYQVPALADLACEIFQRRARGLWPASFADGDSFELLAAAIYDTIPAPTHGIRLTAVAETVRCLPEFRRDGAERLRNLLEGLPDFAADLVLALTPPPTPAVGPREEESTPTPFPLHRAASAGDLARVRALLATGLPGRGPCEVDQEDEDGETALHFATWKGHLPVTKALIEEGGANIDAQGWKYGRTPLHWANDRMRAYGGEETVPGLKFAVVAAYLDGKGAKDE